MMNRSKQVLAALLMLGVELLASLIGSSSAQAVDPTPQSSSAQLRRSLNRRRAAPVAPTPRPSAANQATLDLRLQVPRYNNVTHSINVKQRQFETSVQRGVVCGSEANTSVSAVAPTSIFSLDDIPRGIDILGLALALPQMIQEDCFRNSR